ncbi:MAG TPA: alpha/beta fold hydrolase [Blastocatellia bacterium]
MPHSVRWASNHRFEKHIINGHMASLDQAPPQTKKSRRWLKWLARIAVTVLALLLLFLFVVVPYLLAGLATHATTRPMDRALTATPSDYGLKFQDIEFQTPDGVKISGWLIPSAGKHATIIYSHGLFRSRRELLARAADLCHLGYGALLYDARDHGLSGKAITSLGYFERLDAEGAVSFLRDQQHSPGKIVLLGVSMGAAADLMAAAETPGISAVISDSSFSTLKNTVAHHLRLFLHLPAFPFADELDFFISLRGGFDADLLSPLAAVKKIPCPVLFIAGEHDRRMPPSIARELYENCSSPGRALLVVDGPETAVHGHSYLADPALYVKTVSQFLDKALANT